MREVREERFPNASNALVSPSPLASQALVDEEPKQE